MTSQAINNHNKARFDEFEHALDAVRTAFDELAKLGKTLDDNGTADRFEGWQVPSKGEVQSDLRAASSALDTLRTAATKRKAELISRGWRV
ncbi:hypothetical protein [Amycolatopsis rubida]|uniref:Uncharacterized protein n=1 Tax=Amycolatopsis rubida TaxID=112413 RepID=A0A1I5EF59_9PSEU|nr:hypothetical protein [Amycolatopsis rubida]SFO10095.1 hypothetical protein SAMN05421854_101619 [Amycolatopsis rubida]